MKKLLFVDKVDESNTEDYQIPKDKLIFTYVPSYDNTTPNCDYIPMSQWVRDIISDYGIITFSRFDPRVRTQRLDWDYNNRHHFRPVYLFRSLIVPLLEKLGIEFNWHDDFEVIHPSIQFPEFAFLEPKNRSRHLTIKWGDNIKETNDWWEIHGYGNTLYKERANYYKDSLYHKIICFPHACSGYINKEAKYDKKILVSGDSHAIPAIPALSHFFKEVVYLDNRGKWGPDKLLEDFGRFDYYVFMLSDCHSKHHFFKKNFGIK